MESASALPVLLMEMGMPEQQALELEEWLDSVPWHGAWIADDLAAALLRWRDSQLARLAQAGQCLRWGESQFDKSDRVADNEGVDA